MQSSKAVCIHIKLRNGCILRYIYCTYSRTSWLVNIKCCKYNKCMYTEYTHYTHSYCSDILLYIFLISDSMLHSVCRIRINCIRIQFFSESGFVSESRLLLNPDPGPDQDVLWENFTSEAGRSITLQHKIKKEIFRSVIMLSNIYLEP
jgi:hypothetical protein